MLPANRNLPKLDELYADPELASKHNDLAKLLNAQPKEQWIETNKFANNSKYVPIAIQEYLLSSIFGRWRLEVKDIQVIANSVVATVRLYVLNPIDNEWDWQDGVGAAPIQTAKGAAATDFSQVNTLAVQMGAPAAESYAFKDACEKFGRIFGKDLNRKQELNYTEMQERKFANTVYEIPGDVLRLIEEATNGGELANIYLEHKELQNNPKFMKIINHRTKILNDQSTRQPS